MNQEKVKNINQTALKCFQENFPISGNIVAFPKNCCEETSFILLAILEKFNIYDFKVIKGEAADNKKHFWLESTTHIIDLTCHQFVSIEKPAIFTLKEEYTLNKIFYIQIPVEPPNNWEYLNELKQRIFKIFFTQYYPTQVDFNI